MALRCHRPWTMQRGETLGQAGGVTAGRQPPVELHLAPGDAEGEGAIDAHRNTVPLSL